MRSVLSPVKLLHSLALLSLFLSSLSQLPQDPFSNISPKVLLALAPSLQPPPQHLAHPLMSLQLRLRELARVPSLAGVHACGDLRVDPVRKAVEDRVVLGEKEAGGDSTATGDLAPTAARVLLQRVAEVLLPLLDRVQERLPHRLR